MTPSAHAVREQVLEPAMEIRAVTLEQHREITALVATLHRVLQANLRAGALAREIAGTGDELARVLHADVTSGAAQQLGIKGAARHLRPALRVLSAPAEHDSRELVEAVRGLDAAGRALSASQLRSPSLRHELGQRPHDLLLDLLDARGCALDIAA